MEYMSILIIALLITAFVWIWQFVFLMSIEDGIFPGQHDKILWVAAFLVIPVLSPFAFMLWRGVKMNQRQKS